KLVPAGKSDPCHIFPVLHPDFLLLLAVSPPAVRRRLHIHRHKPQTFHSQLLQPDSDNPSAPLVFRGLSSEILSPYAVHPVYWSHQPEHVQQLAQSPVHLPSGLRKEVPAQSRRHPHPPSHATKAP